MFPMEPMEKLASISANFQKSSKVSISVTLFQVLKDLAEILLPSAVHLDERLTVSQSVPEPASRHSDRYTQFGFFVSGRCGPKQQGGRSQQSKQWPSGNAADRHPCGRRFEP